MQKQHSLQHSARHPTPDHRAYPSSATPARRARTCESTACTSCTSTRAPPSISFLQPTDRWPTRRPHHTRSRHVISNFKRRHRRIFAGLGAQPQWRSRDAVGAKADRAQRRDRLRFGGAELDVGGLGGDAEGGGPVARGGIRHSDLLLARQIDDVEG